jgi:uncharacterized protein YuzE
MRARYDPEADALYVRLSEGRIQESEEMRPNLIVDYDENGRLVAVEVLSTGKTLARVVTGLADVEASYQNSEDAWALRLAPGDIARVEEPQPGVVIDLDARGRILAIEVKRASEAMAREALAPAAE